MFAHRRTIILLSLAASLALAACGGDGLPTSPDDLGEGTGDDYQARTDARTDPIPASPLDASPSPAPAPTATPSAPGWGGPPNDFRRTIGKGYLSNWLFRPTGLAVSGNLLFIGDGNRASLRGTHGAVLAFDGASDDAFTSHSGMYYERRIGPTTMHLLASKVHAVAVTDTLVLASDEHGVKGFIRAIPENAINGGGVIAPPCRDLVVAGNVLYMAQAGQVTALKNGTWEATPGLSVSANGLGADAQGRLWVATANRITAYQAGQKVLEFDGKGTDGSGPGATQFQDVAVDGRTGEVYALDQGQVLRFDGAGKFLARFGGGRIGLGGSLVVGADGSVYVSDRQNGEVYQFRPSR